MRWRERHDGEAVKKERGEGVVKWTRSTSASKEGEGRERVVPVRR